MDNNIVLFQGFNIFMRAMREFIAERLQRTFGENWWTEGVAAALDDLPADARQPDRARLIQIHHIPMLFQHRWDACFAETFKHREKTVGRLEEVVDMSQTVYPGCTNTVSDDDTWRCIDTMARLVRMVNPPAADEILKLRHRREDSPRARPVQPVGGEPAGKDGKEDESGSDSSFSMDMDRLLEKQVKIEKEKLKIESLLQKKFSKCVTVMFTDLQGSVAMGEAEGDIASRLVIKKHRDILQPIISRNKGVLVKYLGDGTLSYYDGAFDALSAAIQIQKSTDDYNDRAGRGVPILLRIGLHTGSCLVEAHDLMGDVVNVSARIQALAKTGGIFLSEETYNTLPDHGKESCRFEKSAAIKGKKNAFNLYAVIRPGEKSEEPPVTGGPGGPSLLVKYADGTEVSFPITERETTIGRSKKCAVSFSEPFVSRDHACIIMENDVCHIKDLGSRIGVFVNEQKADDRKLKNGDTIRIGENRITYIDNRDGSDSGSSSVTRIVQSEPHAAEQDRQPLLRLLVTSDKSDPGLYAIGKARLTIGRSPENAVVLEGRDVAARHAAMWLEGGKVFIEDLGGARIDAGGGTRIDNAAIQPNTPVELKKRMSAGIGPYRLKILDPEETFDPADFKTGLLNISKLTNLFRKKIV
jgi:class 3 adenylate cyclase